MKKSVSILGCILFALVALTPFSVLLASFTKYVFEPVSYTAFAVATALLSIFLVFLSVFSKQAVENIIVKVLFALATPLALISAIIYMFEATVLIVVSVLICVFCCCYLTIKHGKPLALKIASMALFFLTILLIVFFGFMALIFGQIGKTTVVRSIESPNGLHYAEVIDKNDGALGGDTLVDIHDNREINLLLFKITKKAQRVYRGPWGEFENMKIYWKDDDRLVINSIEYDIK